jgi:hypothetical protein
VFGRRSRSCLQSRPSSLNPPTTHHPPHFQSAAIVYAKAGGAPAAFSDSPASLLVGEALGSSALLTFFLWWALSHNYLHLFE